MKVYRYPNNFEQVSEMAEHIGSYSNYEEDVYAELPVLPEEYQEVLVKGGFDSTIDFPMVVYTLDDPNDIEDIDVNTFHGATFGAGDFSFYDENYFVAGSEYGASVFIAPIEYKEAIVEHLNRQSYEEEEDIHADYSKYVGSSKKRSTNIELSTASKKLFDKLYK